MADNVILCIGMPGSGKTTLVARGVLFDTGERQRCRALCYDPTGDLQTAIKRGKAYEKPSDAIAALKRGERVAYVQPKTPRALSSARDAFREAMLDAEAFMEFVCDEAETLFPLHSKEDSVDNVVRMARNKRIRLMLCAKRPQDLSLAVRTCTTNLCVFKLDSRNTVKAVAVAGELEQYTPALSLKRGQYIYRGTWAEPTDKLPCFDSKLSAIPWGELI